VLLLMMALAAATAQAAPDLDAVATGLLARTNDLRRDHDRPTLERNARLERAAREFADFMASHDEFGHEADGRTPTDRARAAGYRDCMVAENVAYEMRTRPFATEELAEAFFRGFAGSAGHRRNLLDADAVEIGVAVAHSEETSRYYAVQLFGQPESLRIGFEVRNESQREVRYEVGGKSFVLPGRSQRLHRVCGEVRLAFEHRGGARTFQPAEGEVYLFTPEGTLKAP
jgi:hypothetical protein